MPPISRWIAVKIVEKTKSPAWQDSQIDSGRRRGLAGSLAGTAARRNGVHDQPGAGQIVAIVTADRLAGSFGRGHLDEGKNLDCRVLHQVDGLDPAHLVKETLQLGLRNICGQITDVKSFVVHIPYPSVKGASRSRL